MGLAGPLPESLCRSIGGVGAGLDSCSVLYLLPAAEWEAKVAGPQCWVQRVWLENLCDGRGATKGIRRGRSGGTGALGQELTTGLTETPDPLVFWKPPEPYPALPCPTLGAEPRTEQESSWSGSYVLAFHWAPCTPPHLHMHTVGLEVWGSTPELRAWPQPQICTAARSCPPRAKAGKEREEAAWVRATRQAAPVSARTGH